MDDASEKKTLQWEVDVANLVGYLKNPETDLAICRAAWDTVTDMMLNPDESEIFEDIMDELAIHEKASKLVRLIEARWDKANQDALSSQKRRETDDVSSG